MVKLEPKTFTKDPHLADMLVFAPKVMLECLNIPYACILTTTPTITLLCYSTPQTMHSTRECSTLVHSALGVHVFFILFVSQITRMPIRTCPFKWIGIPLQTDFHANKLYKDGSFILQDKASCFPAHVLTPTPGAHCIDAYVHTCDATRGVHRPGSSLCVCVCVGGGGCNHTYTTTMHRSGSLLCNHTVLNVFVIIVGVCNHTLAQRVLLSLQSQA